MNTENKAYPSCLSNEEWQLIIPHLPAKSLIGRPLEYEWRQLINGICYVLRTSCPWRYVPRDFGNWQAVYRAFHKLGGLDFWEKLNAFLAVEVRLEAKREVLPSAAIIDSQTVKSTPTASYHGYDAAKKTKGSKRHILVDTLGLVLAVVIHDASIVDCNGAKAVFEQAAKQSNTARLELIFADGGYARATSYLAAYQHGWHLEVLERPPDSQSFVVIKKRWVVERTFAWLARNRRLARDYERLPKSAVNFIYLAMCRIMLARLTKQ
jgi:putative transposase